MENIDFGTARGSVAEMANLQPPSTPQPTTLTPLLAPALLPQTHRHPQLQDQDAIRSLRAISHNSCRGSGTAMSYRKSPWLQPGEGEHLAAGLQPRIQERQKVSHYCSNEMGPVQTCFSQRSVWLREESRYDVLSGYFLKE